MAQGQREQSVELGSQDDLTRQGLSGRLCVRSHSTWARQLEGVLVWEASSRARNCAWSSGLYDGSSFDAEFFNACHSPESAFRFHHSQARRTGRHRRAASRSSVDLTRRSPSPRFVVEGVGRAMVLPLSGPLMVNGAILIRPPRRSLRWLHCSSLLQRRAQALLFDP